MKLNGRTIRVSDVKTLDNAIVSFGFPAADRQKRAETMKRVEWLADRVGSVRVFNCAALLLCYVAAGRIDASFEMGIHLWDMAAGALLVSEAGGKVCFLDGSPLNLSARENLVGNAALVELIAQGQDEIEG